MEGGGSVHWGAHMERQSRRSRCILGKAVNQPAFAEDVWSSAAVG